MLFVTLLRLTAIQKLLFGALVAFMGHPALAAQPVISPISVQGTEIVVELANGKTLRSKDLVGAVLDVRFKGQPAKLRIVDVEPDPADRSGTVWFHTFEIQQSDGSWRNLCAAGPDGRQQGFPVQGIAHGLDLACSSGAVGKCVRSGYRPWADGPDGRSLEPQHAACVRMYRADYGGTGEPWTRNGMNIDLYDLQGIQKPDMAADQAFEAGWSVDGAVCVHHVRVKENTTLAELEEKYPRLKGRTGPICTEEYARSLGATMFNRSQP
jgi:hypothetical protein